MWFTTFVLKNLRRRPLRSILTIFAIAMAIGSVVSLVGLANGFERTFLSLYKDAKIDMIVLRAGAQQRLTSALPETLGKRIAKVPGVKQVYLGLVDMISLEEPANDRPTVVIQGWPPETPVFDHLTVPPGQGRKLLQTDDRAVMLGTILADNLGKKPGDKVEIMEKRFYTVVGIYESRSGIENGAVVIPLKELQTIMQRDGLVTGFSLELDDPNDPQAVEAVRQNIQALWLEPSIIGSAMGQAGGAAPFWQIGWTVESRNKPLPPLKAFATADYIKSFTEIQMAKGMAWLTSCIALLIGFFGITNTMVMSVNERTREIGILRAVGWQVRRIIRMIMLESVLLSMVGALVGALGAIVIGQVLTRVRGVSGLIDTRIDLVFLLYGFLIAVALGLMGSIIPAIRAVQMTPTEALRHE
jgi:putative ABC transport system permease protein